MVTLHRIRLASVSLAGAVRNGTCRRLLIGDRTLVFTEFLDRARSSGNSELVGIAEDSTSSSDYRDIIPVVAEFGAAVFAGYIDTFSGTLTLQREHIRDVDRAMEYALCAAKLRNVSDRTGNHLPTRVVPFAEELGPLLDAAVAGPEVTVETPVPEAIAA